MSYLEKNVIGTNEKIILTPRKNKIFLVMRWVWGILGCWLLLIPTIKAIISTIKFCNLEYLVTDKNVYKKSGWLNSTNDSMGLSKIENVVVKQSFFGKIFNYYTVTIKGANYNEIEFEYVKNGNDIKKEIMNLLNE